MGQRVRPGSWVRCAGPDADQGLLSSARAEQLAKSLHRLGIFRREDGACFMLFYAGAVLRQTPLANCHLELELERSDVDDCGSIELYVDGEEHGRLREIETSSGTQGRIRCARQLDRSDLSQVRVGVFFTDTDLRSLYGELSEVSKHYQMHELGLVCEP